MLKGYTFKNELAAGCLGIVDLYTKNNKQYVLKTCPLSPDENIRVFSNEFSFSRLVHMMPDNEAKYFMKLIAADTVKGIKFDNSRLCKLNDVILKDENNLMTKVHNLAYNSETNYVRLLYPYVGVSVDSRINKMLSEGKIDYTFTKRLVKDLINIVAITRKYKWLIRDLHTNNICVQPQGNIVLIDYGLLVDIYCINDQNNVWRYHINADLWDVILIAANHSYRFEVYKSEIFTEDTNKKLFNAVIASKKWKTIKRYLSERTIMEVVTDCINGDYSRIIHIIYFIDVIFSIIDHDGSESFWIDNNKSFVPNTPMLLKNAEMIKLLDMTLEI